MNLKPTSSNLSFNFSYYLKLIIKLKKVLNMAKLKKSFSRNNSYKYVLKSKILTFNSNFLVFTYFFKSHCNSKKNSLNFFLISYQNKLTSVNKFLMNLFSLGFFFLFFSNSFFKDKPLYIN